MSITGAYGYVLAFLATGFLFGILLTTLPNLLSPKSKGKKRTATYESGEDTIGSAWVQFDIIYYLFALIFIAFDVEAVFLFPVLTAFRGSDQFYNLFKILLFIGILALALAYAWKKRVLDWKF